MELNLEDLDKVTAGGNRELSEESALKNSDLYRKEQIERLKQEKERLLEMKNKELTLEELDQVMAGQNMKDTAEITK